MAKTKMARLEKAKRPRKADICCSVLEVGIGMNVIRSMLVTRADTPICLFVQSLVHAFPMADSLKELQKKCKHAFKAEGGRIFCSTCGLPSDEGSGGFLLNSHYFLSHLSIRHIIRAPCKLASLSLYLSLSSFL